MLAVRAGHLCVFAPMLARHSINGFFPSPEKILDFIFVCRGTDKDISA